jgi:hypothetical protein
MSSQQITAQRAQNSPFRYSTNHRSSLLFTTALVVLLISQRSHGSPGADGGVAFDTVPYWAAVQGIIGGFGPGQSSTLGETFVAPSGANVTLNDFSFYAESYYPYNGGIANIYLQAFVYEWSGRLTGQGGRAIGDPIYLGASFPFSPPPRPNGWVPLTASFEGNGLTLIGGNHYVIGFTLSSPANYAASQGDIEFQEVPNRNPNEPELPAGVDGNGGAVWDNNGNNFAVLNSATWDTWGDIGDLAFTAHLTVVPEPSSLVMIGAAGFCTVLGRCRCFHRLQKNNR